MALTAGGTTSYWKGRCGVAYLTDGTLTDQEVADFHAALRDYLLIPSGKWT
jgi:hypothetical protein